MLSTPTAKTMNGITSIIIKVAGKPTKPNNPTELATEASTINIPRKKNNKSNHCI